MKTTHSRPKFGWVGSSEPSPELWSDMEGSAKALNVDLVNKRLSVTDDIHEDSDFAGAFLVDAKWLTGELIAKAKTVGFTFIGINSYRVRDRN